MVVTSEPRLSGIVCSVAHSWNSPQPLLTVCNYIAIYVFFMSPIMHCKFLENRKLAYFVFHWILSSLHNFWPPVAPKIICTGGRMDQRGISGGKMLKEYLELKYVWRLLK